MQFFIYILKQVLEFYYVLLQFEEYLIAKIAASY